MFVSGPSIYKLKVKALWNPCTLYYLKSILDPQSNVLVPNLVTYVNCTPQFEVRKIFALMIYEIPYMDLKKKLRKLATTLIRIWLHLILIMCIIYKENVV
jgi:hypothetical protein